MKLQGFRFFSVFFISFLSAVFLFSACGKSAEKVSADGKTDGTSSSAGGASASSTFGQLAGDSSGSGDTSSKNGSTSGSSSGSTLFGDGSTSGSGDTSGTTGSSGSSSSNGSSSTQSALQNALSGLSSLSGSGDSSVQNGLSALNAYINLISQYHNASSSQIANLNAHLTSINSSLTAAAQALSANGQKALADIFIDLANRQNVLQLWKPQLPRVIYVVNTADVAYLTQPAVGFTVTGIGFQTRRTTTNMTNPAMLYLCSNTFSTTKLPIFYTHPASDCGNPASANLRPLGYVNRTRSGKETRELVRSFNFTAMDAITTINQGFLNVAAAYGYGTTSATRNVVGYTP